MSVRVRSTGQLAEVLYYDASDPDLTYKLKLPNGQVTWYPKNDVEVLVDEEKPAQVGSANAESTTVDVRPPPYQPSAELVGTYVAPLRQPLLPSAPAPGSAERLMASCTKEVASWSCGACISIIFVVAAFSLAVGRNSHCVPADLINVTPPYNGELLPANFTLVERWQPWQLTKLVDVYDAETGAHAGYFYDMDFFLFFRVGYSDASDRIWFEAKYVTFFDRFQYYLQRCDVGATGRSGGIFHVQENLSARSFFCFSNCYRAFNVSRRVADDKQCSDGACFHPVANVAFNSTLQWVESGLLPTWRHEWYMNLTNPSDGSEVAFARQRFDGKALLGLKSKAVSRWSVEVEKEEPYLPNWVVGFMAALDDIEEEEGK